MQEDFWSRNPCGVDGDYAATKEQRFRMEPWLQGDLTSIKSGHGKYLEVGCGQGTDSIEICRNLQVGDTYIGIDYSKESVSKAEKHLEEANNIRPLLVRPFYKIGDALNLELENDSIDFIYSMGVIHHTPNPQKAIDEIYRVLKPGGSIRVFLYRKYSLKVGVAKFLRFLQVVLDKITRRDLSIYEILKKQELGFFGTMFLECFGVPWMEWYSEDQLKSMFGKFKNLELVPYGYNLPRLSGSVVDGKNNFGYFFRIEASK